MRPAVSVLCVVLSLGLAACATGSSTNLAVTKAEGPKIVALDAPRTPWVVEIESRLRQDGFQVLRWSSTSRIREQTSETRTEEFRKSATRYVLVIDGYAPLDPMNRCFGGGFNFSYLTVELVDTKANETMVSFSGTGYSENCQPLSGTIFSDMGQSIASAWK